MNMKRSYSDQFIDAVRFFTELNGGKPDYNALRAHIKCKQSNSAKSQSEIWVERIAKFAEFIVQDRVRNGFEVINNCHTLADDILTNWQKISGAGQAPLAITIGNIFYKGDCVYNVSETVIKRILNEGVISDKPLDVHVWLTLENMSVIDPTFLCTLAVRNIDISPYGASPVLVWNENIPSDFRYEPILVDNDFYSKVDR